MRDERQAAIGLIQRLPDDATTTGIIEELYFKQRIDNGFHDAVEGRLISHTEMKGKI